MSAPLTPVEALARIVFCLEAVELHEPAVAVAILRDLESDLRSQILRVERRTCRECGVAFDLPGQLVDHLLHVRDIDDDGQAAAT